jgi:5-hydroxyisourate hydrolase
MSLSTHVLDTAKGAPAAGMTLRLLQGETVLFGGATDQDGRCPALRGLTLATGRYRLEFAVADYWRNSEVALPDPPFLEVIPIDFGIAEADSHYHVPLLLSPYGYSTYRGS